MPDLANPQLSFAGFSDSLLGADWRPLVDGFDALGPDELAGRAATARRVLREQGITCYAAENDRPWELDILPMVFSAREWRTLEAGITQRARLLNRFLVDLYGSQRTLRDGWLPSPLIYANPNYLRPCQGVRVPGGNYLPFYAVDLARAEDGSWWVLADRTQNPAGLGFALENRALVSRVLPEMVQALRPRSLDGAMGLIREVLGSLSPASNGAPMVVVLTPGSRNEAYYEHTYLARKLCCTVAEGADLTVRGRRVYLKTLEGLQPVDVILRRVNDAYCDPLEFRSDSLLGIPGLLEAVRAGNVVVANALGCGLVESPAFLAFLPTLCQRLLGEELAIPSVATWWCGGGEELREVRSQMERLKVRSAFSLAASVERQRTPEERVELEARLLAAPHEFVGQEEVCLSRIPVLRDQGTQGAEPFYFRAFVVGDGTHYHVLPGGLVRLPQQSRLTTSLFPIAQESKDAWVLSDGEGDPIPPEVVPVENERVPIDLPSRAADNLFWLGRYAERLEHIARITRCVLGYGVETGSRRIEALSGFCWRLGLQPSGGELLIPGLIGMVADPLRRGGVRDLIGQMHQAAFSVRDRLSGDMWRLLNRVVQTQGECTTPMGALSVLDALVLDLAAFSGMEMENMTRGHGWLFLDLGRRLERSSNLLGLIQSVMYGPDLLYEPLLQICDSVITFRQRYFTAIRLPDVLDLLLKQTDNPRSLAFMLATLKRAVAHLPEEPNRAAVLEIRGQIAAVSSQVLALKPCGDVSDALVAISARLRTISDLMTRTYFSHSIPRVS